VKIPEPVAIKLGTLGYICNVNCYSEFGASLFMGASAQAYDL